MRPMHLTATGYRSFADLSFAFPDGATAVVGANGSGKSSLLSAVELALFGARGRSLEPFVTEGADSMRLGLLFEHAGQTYRVRRGWQKGKSTLDLERRDGPDGWAPLTQGNAADTQQLVEETIGMSRATFLASAYLAQRESDTFTAAQPRDRKRLLSDALRLDDWEQAAAAVAADRRAAQQRQTEVDARLAVAAEQKQQAAALAEDAARLAHDLTAAEELAAHADEEHAHAADAHAAAQQAEHEWQQRRQQLETAAARLQPLKQTADDAALAHDRAASLRADTHRLEALAADLALTQQEHTRLVDQDRARTDALAAQRRRETEVDRLADDRRGHDQARTLAMGKLAALTQPDAVCDRCGQHVADTALVAAQLSLEQERDTAVAAIARLDRDIADLALRPVVIPEPAVGLDQLRARVAELATAPAQLAATRERLAAVEALIERATEPAFTDALEQAERDFRQAAAQVAETVKPDTGPLRETAESARKTAEAARERHATIRIAHARAQAQADQTAQAAAAHDDLAEERDRLTQELDVLAGLEQAFGRDGIPAWIVEAQAVPHIEREANRILTRLGGAIRRLELRTETETKTGDRREALEIVCLTDTGERAYQHCSGGEKTRVEISLAFGLARLLGARHGTDLRWFAADEPPGLDEQGTEALAQALNEVAAAEDVVVMVVTHDRLRDSFDSSIRCQRNGNGRSEIAA